MRAMFSRWARAVARRLRVRRALSIMLRREPLRSEHVALGLKRDIQVPFSAPEAKIPVRVRPIRPTDLPSVAPSTPSALPMEEVGDWRNRTVLATSGVGHGFVAESEDGQPCYVQWLLGPEDVERLRWHFGAIFPRLGPDEMLLEGAYTPQPYRGQGVMAHAMAKIAEQGATFGARRVITFSTESNIPSVKGCQRAGFLPYVRRIDRWSGLRRTLTFLPLSEPFP